MFEINSMIIISCSIDIFIKLFIFKYCISDLAWPRCPWQSPRWRRSLGGGWRGRRPQRWGACQPHSPPPPAALWTPRSGCPPPCPSTHSKIRQFALLKRKWSAARIPRYYTNSSWYCAKMGKAWTISCSISKSQPHIVSFLTVWRTVCVEKFSKQKILGISSLHYCKHNVWDYMIFNLNPHCHRSYTTHKTCTVQACCIQNKTSHIFFWGIIRSKPALKLNIHEKTG